MDMFENELEVAKEIAKKAGKLLLKREQVCIDSAIGRDIKLSSDKESEKLILEGLSSFEYSILSEECGFKDAGTELCWIVDPLDGTMNYLKGLDDLTCVSISLFKKSEPILGVVYRYKTDEMFWGMIGERAYLNGAEIQSSNVSDISQAVLGTGFPVGLNYDEESLKQYIDNAQKFKKVRMLGTAAIMATFVACGRLDAYMEDNVMLWDIAAADAILQAAGGICELQLLENNRCICRCYANKDLQEDYELS